MKRTAIVIGFWFFAGISCNKEYSCEDCEKSLQAVSQPTQPPVARAGPDISVVLPIASLDLDGTSSFDTDGTIVSYSWLQLNGPSPITIANSNTAKATATGFAEGNYQFSLRVTDNSGLQHRDTIQVSCIKRTTSNSEFVFYTKWSCNNSCTDADVYLSTLQGLGLFGDPNAPLEVFILLNPLSNWIAVPAYTNPLPANTNYYYLVRNGILYVHAVATPGVGDLVGESVTLKIRFL